MSSTQPTASHFIGGRYVEDKSGSRFDVIYPASGAVIAQIHAGTDQIIEQALGAAQAAQQDWAARSGTERGRVLRRAADLIRARNRELSVLETHDTGKPLSETLYADATSGADALEYFGGLAGNVTGEHIQLGENWVYTRREALGICLGIGAWNYPTQIACWKAAPALACGNAMIFKPSETTPLCALKIAETLSEAGLPDGVFNVVQGQGDVGAALLQDPRINKVSLTGSVATGRKVYQSAAVGLKQVTLELGGKSPLIIFEDADLENAVGGAILANFYSSGQICSNGTRVFVHKAIKEAFLDRLSARLEQAVIGDPLDETTNFGPLVSDRQMQIVQGFIAQGISEGARLICGGRRLERPGYYLAPTVFADVSDQMTIAREEIFGPVLSVLDFDDEGDVVARANNTEYGLSAGVFTRDISRAHRVIGKLQAGSCFINSYNDAPVEAPFGGMKLSGIGRENSKNAIEHYSQLKSVYVRMGDVDAPF
ncbi:putative aldehyde dehydrogenase AldA [Rhodobacteraceae bacterium SB2]|nr:putative aldehyde dehydrogenase AldA [Rhodobacteraceae bacterium SB2]